MPATWGLNHKGNTLSTSQGSPEQKLGESWLSGRVQRRSCQVQRSQVWERREAHLPGHPGALCVCKALVLTLGGKFLSYLFFELYVCVFLILLSILPTPEIFN